MAKRRPLWRRTWFWAAAFIVSIVGGWLLYGWEDVHSLQPLSAGPSGGLGSYGYRIVERVVPPVITAFATLTASVGSLIGIVLTYRMNRRQLELELAKLDLEMKKIETQTQQTSGA